MNISTHKCVFAVAFISALILFPVFSFADPIDNWTLRQSGTTRDLYKVTYGDGKFVAVGGYGVILSSPDGVNWTNVYSDDSIHAEFCGLGAVAYGNGVFVAVGGGGTIMTSTDGIDWTKTNSDPALAYRDPVNNVIHGVLSSHDLWGIVYANDTFVAYGKQCVILTSPDGFTWTEKFADDSFFQGSGYGINGVAYADGIFVTQGDRIFASQDTNDWTQTAGGSNAVTYANNLFVAGGRQSIRTSPDGITWTERYPYGTLYKVEMDQILFGNGSFVASAHRFGKSSERERKHDPGFYMFTSPDGITWKKRKAQAPGGIVYGNCRFVTANSMGVYGSSNGVNWKKAFSVDGRYPTGAQAVFCHNAFIVTGIDIFGSIIATSRDGINWNVGFDDPQGNGIDAVVYGAHSFVAVGADGIILQSDEIPQAQFDLAGQWNSVNVVCRDTPAGEICKISAKLDVQNIGPQDSSAVFVKFYLSRDTEYNEWDVLLLEKKIKKIKAGKALKVSLSKKLTPDAVISGQYLLAVLDGDGIAWELDKSNNIAVMGPLQ